MAGVDPSGNEKMAGVWIRWTFQPSLHQKVTIDQKLLTKCGSKSVQNFVVIHNKMLTIQKRQVVEQL